MQLRGIVGFMLMRVRMFNVEEVIARPAGTRIFIIDKMRKRYGKTANRHNNGLYPTLCKQVAYNNDQEAGYQQSQWQYAVMLFKV